MVRCNDRTHSAASCYNLAFMMDIVSKQESGELPSDANEVNIDNKTIHDVYGHFECSAKAICDLTTCK